MHIQEKEWKAYFDGMMPIDKRMELLEHIADCTFCADRLAAGFPKQQILPVHPELQFRILHKVRSQKKQQLFLKKTEYSRYCMKVGLGICCAVIMVFQTGSMQTQVLSWQKTAEAYVKEQSKAHEKNIKARKTKQWSLLEHIQHFFESEE